VSRARRGAGEVAPAERRLWRVGLAILALLPWYAWRDVLGLELLGWDSYPLVAAGRVADAGELAGTFGEELMDGRYPLGRYWRPLVHLSFALDHALWGLAPRGYHATDLALLSLNAVLVALLAGKLLGRRVGFLAGLYFVLHPVHADVLWAPARRADALALACTLAALVASLSFGARPWLRRAAVAAACAAALGSKESGAVALPLVALLQTLLAPQRERVRRAAREGGLAVAAVTAVLALRTAVLGGLGGARGGELSGALAGFPAALARYAVAAFGGAGLRVGVPVGLGFALAALVAAAVALLVGWFLRRPDGTRWSPLDRLPLFAFVAAWFLVLASVTALAGAERGWYELPFAALNALFLGAALALASDALERSRRRRAGPAVVTALALLVGWPALAALLRPGRFLAPELAQASAAQREFLARLERELERSEPGRRIELDRFPMELRCADPGLDGRARTVTALSPYGVEAYVELVAPRHRGAKAVPYARPSPAGGAEVVLVLEP
jgi:hypothetical protein